MLGVGLKKTEKVDMVAPLKQFITSNHAQTDMKGIEAALSQINDLRNKMMASLEKNDDVKFNIEVFSKYLGVIESLSNRFPFGDVKSGIFGKGKVPSVRIQFSWFDAFRKMKKAQDYDINFEKACILFNIAASHSRQGIRDKRNEDGLAEASKQFKIAAGVFDHLVEHHLSQNPLAVDLSKDTVKMLSMLMLAQAQACFFEKATSTGATSPALIAKLAAGTAELFKNAAQLCEAPDLKLWIAQSLYPWQTHCQYQQYCFLSSSHYWNSKALLKEDKYGEEIGHLHRAREMAEEARKLNQGALLANLEENRFALEKAINSRLSIATKDNDTIYFLPVLRGSDVKPIEPKVVVQSIAYAMPKSEEKDPFSSLVSQEVQQQSDSFTQKFSASLTTIAKQCTDDTNLAKQHLASLNLPAALEALAPDKGLPEELWAKIKDAQYKGGWDALHALHNKVMDQAMGTVDLHKAIKANLAREAEEDNAMQVQFGRRWNRRPSSQITASFQRDMDAIQAYLRDANISNSKISDEMKAHEAKIRGLSDSRDAVEARMPTVSADGKTAESVNLTKMLDELSALLDKRSKTLDDLRKFVQGTDFSGLISAAKNKLPENIFKEESTKLEEKQKAIEAINAQQMTLLEKVTGANQAFVRTKEKNADRDAREKVMQEINVGLDVFTKLMANLNEGSKFYNDLVKDRLEPLKQAVDDFTIARDMEKRLILDQLTKDLAGYHDPHGANPNLQYERSSQPLYPGGSPPAAAAAAPGGAPTYQLQTPQYQNQAPVQQFQTPQYQYQHPTQSGAGAGYPGARPVSPNPTPSPMPSSYHSPSAPPASAPASSTPAAGGWVCPLCTFSNQSLHLQCAMCGSTKT